LCTIVALLLEVIEESEDQIGIQVGHSYGSWRFLDLCFSERQKQPECVAISRNGARTDCTMLSEVLDKEALKQCWEG
jgi:hypothetical protein